MRVFARFMCVVTVMVFHAGCTYVGDHTIDRPFEGITHYLSPGKTLRLLVVHGMGEHCIGHASQLVHGLASELAMSETDGIPRFGPDCDSARDRQRCVELGDACKVIAKIDPDDGETYVYGFLRLQDFERADGAAFRLFELTWDPTTRWAKDDFLSFDWAERHKKERVLLDALIKKKIMNDGFSDAVLYVGSYGVHMQVPIVESFCWVLLPNPFDRERCDPMGSWNDPRVRGPDSDDDPIIVITSSLGSKMVIDSILRILRIQRVGPLSVDSVESRDTRRLLELLGFDPENDRELASFDVALKEFTNRLRIVYMLANQLPLLRLGKIASRTPLSQVTATRRQPSQVRQEILEEQKEFAELLFTISVIAISDPNDILSYPIPERNRSPAESPLGETSLGLVVTTVPDVTTVPGVTDVLNVTDVTTNIANAALFGVIVHPGTAHAGHDDDAFVLRLIACGAIEGRALRC